MYWSEISWETPAAVIGIIGGCKYLAISNVQCVGMVLLTISSWLLINDAQFQAADPVAQLAVPDAPYKDEDNRQEVPHNEITVPLPPATHIEPPATELYLETACPRCGRTKLTRMNDGRMNDE